VCIGIASVTGKDKVIEGGSEGTEEPKNRCLDAGGIGFREFMEDGSGTGGTVTAMARPTLTTGFNFILPVGAENDGITGTRARLAKHTEVLKLVTLLTFSFVPEGPGRKYF
jgi:hypothetical protein